MGATVSLAYMGGLFYLSSLPGSATGPNTLFWRVVSNALHIPLFAGLAGCLVLAFRAWALLPRAAWVAAIGVAYLLFDEWHQSWTPGRSMSLSDVGLDLIGITLVIATSLFVRGCR